MVISYRRNRKLIRHVILSGNWENFFGRAQLWSFLQVLALELVSVFFCLQSNMTYCLRALHSDCFIFLSQFCALTGLSWLVPLSIWPGGISGGFSQRAAGPGVIRSLDWGVGISHSLSSSQCCLQTSLFHMVSPLMVAQGSLEPDFHGRRSRSFRPFKGRTWNHTASLQACPVDPSSSGTDQRECGRGPHRVRYSQ